MYLFFSLGVFAVIGGSRAGVACGERWRGDRPRCVRWVDERWRASFGTRENRRYLWVDTMDDKASCIAYSSFGNISCVGVRRIAAFVTLCVCHRKRRSSCLICVARYPSTKLCSDESFFLSLIDVHRYDLLIMIETK